MIRFGTDGWRDIIAENFTYANVRAVAQAHAQYLLAQGAQRVVIGYDTRFQGPNFARVAAETLAANGLEVLLATAYVPTPVLSFAVVHLEAAGGVMITASHNPPLYNGYKIKGAYGGSATPEIAAGIEAELTRLRPTPAWNPEKNPIRGFDVRKAYYAALDRVLDLEVLRAYRGVIYHDAMGGAGAGWIEGYVKHAKLPVEVRAVHGVPHPLFYGVNPEPIPQNLESLSAVLATEQDPVFGTVTDGDADRVGAVTAGGHFFNSHQIFAVLLKHLHDRGLRGRVVKTVSTSTLINLLTARLGLDLEETPVGFKYITDAVLRGQSDPDQTVLIGGEESGGLAVRGHLPERDGILNSLLLLEAVARSGKSLGALFADLEADTGFRHFYDRNDLHLEAGFDKDAFMAHAASWTELAGDPVREVMTRDGVKLALASGAWALLRASGTEPLVRVYVEASSPEAQRALLEEATSRVRAFR
ncbi:phosphomannomutase [Deinobacterium chartae]|uniref:Phosphomannomutase n=1 Tax=Deinobacterium chartae TaxID=521158 RepID=A0A841HVJ9_9DEIO|nr:phosphoglucomutase/phosphomannomutase family protein [Deinobacterium chartae]MBB6096946.1 phosphomannomutase [Deinobacterium chartae]